jgi:anti-sigma factor RsiW
MERGAGGRHGRARDLAATAIDFELADGEARTLRHHLSSCDACRRWTADLEADAVALAGLVRAELVLAAPPARRPVNGSGGRYNPAR